MTDLAGRSPPRRTKAGEWDGGVGGGFVNNFSLTCLMLLSSEYSLNVFCPMFHPAIL